MALKVQHDEQNHRFEAEVDGQTLYLDYRRLDRETLDYESTFVPDDLRGRGLAGELVTHALDWAKDHDYQVVATCPYVQSFIDKHPEYKAVTTRPE
jgi:predicted GNAT family acetyltransferase